MRDFAAYLVYGLLLIGGPILIGTGILWDYKDTRFGDEDLRPKHKNKR